mmetsp:Transcript_9650/g.16691  ORF Transcript_9650/g.16691 Transcript_9650/m.16691 type:complete len:211 (+) Transcript_9650:61-693(+)
MVAKLILRSFIRGAALLARSRRRRRCNPTAVVSGMTEDASTSTNSSYCEQRRRIFFGGYEPKDSCTVHETNDTDKLQISLIEIGERLECQSEATFVKRVLQFKALAKCCHEVHLNHEFDRIMQDFESEASTLKVRMNEQTRRRLHQTRLRLREGGSENDDSCDYLQPSVFDTAAHEALDAMEIAGELRRGSVIATSQLLKVRLCLIHGTP